MKKIGIIGFGSFGAFLAEKLEPHAEIHVSSRRPEAVPEHWRSSFESVATCDYIIPSIPLDTYQAVLEQLKPLLRADAVIVDVCSVKLQPLEIIRSILPDAKVVATHPLFGPESAKDSLVGHTFVVCPDASDPAALKTISNFARSLGLDVVEKTADEHDREMALVHALTFFIAQGLVEMKLESPTIKTPSYGRLLSLAELERHHSVELFKTIQQGNPYAATVRDEFMQKMAAIHEAAKH